MRYSLRVLRVGFAYDIYYSFNDLEKAKEVANNWANSKDAIEVEIYDSEIMHPIYFKEVNNG
jgi:hypothetical protein